MNIIKLYFEAGLYLYEQIQSVLGESRSALICTSPFSGLNVTVNVALSESCSRKSVDFLSNALKLECSSPSVLGNN